MWRRAPARADSPGDAVGRDDDDAYASGRMAFFRARPETANPVCFTRQRPTTSNVYKKDCIYFTEYERPPDADTISGYVGHAAYTEAAGWLQVV